MARKEIVIDIQDREQLLTFKIREMSASQLESSIARAILMLGSDAGGMLGVNIEDTRAVMLMNALKRLSSVKYEEAWPLLDEMLACCSRMVERVEERCTPATVNAYIMDVRTLFRLRMEAIKLNLSELVSNIEPVPHIQ